MRPSARTSPRRGADRVGPYEEAKEHLAGLFLVECESDERAIEVAGRIPEAPYGVVEVRPVLDLGGMEMLDMSGDREAARDQYRLAARRTLSVPEQRYLESRAARLTAR
jgi:hypothetical protein